MPGLSTRSSSSYASFITFMTRAGTNSSHHGLSAGHSACFHSDTSTYFELIKY